MSPVVCHFEYLFSIFNKLYYYYYYIQCYIAKFHYAGISKGYSMHDTRTTSMLMCCAYLYNDPTVIDPPLMRFSGVGADPYVGVGEHGVVLSEHVEQVNPSDLYDLDDVLIGCGGGG